MQSIDKSKNVNKKIILMHLHILIATLEFDFIKDKTYRDSLKNDIMLLNNFKNDSIINSKNPNKARVLFELKNSPNIEGKNFIQMNKHIKMIKKDKTNKKKELLEKFEFDVQESKITKNVKSVLEMVIIYYYYFENLNKNKEKIT